MMSHSSPVPFSSSKTLFAPYLNRILKTHNNKLPQQLSLLSIQKNIIDAIGPALIYIINDYSQKGRLKGFTPEERYNFFNIDQKTIDDAFDDLESLFPFSNKRLNHRLSSLSEIAYETLNIFDKDYDDLVSLGIIPVGAQVLDLAPCGDFHESRSTCYLSFVGGGGVYLKWRTPDNEQLIAEFLDSLGEQGLSLCPKMFGRDNYTWVKEVTREPLDNEFQARNCFRNIGKLACIAYLLGITDLHHENVIPVKSGLIAVDCETTMTINARPPQNVPEATKVVGSEIIDSVLGSALFPVGSAGEIYGGDISALGSGQYVAERRVLTNTFRDDICYKREIVKNEDTKHLPFIVVDGIETPLNPADYKSDIISGFKELYVKSMEKRKELIHIISRTRLQSRILYRRTADYNAILSFTSSPRFRDSYYEKIRQLLESVPGIPNEISSLEARSLLNGDIPFFSVDVFTGYIYQDGSKKLKPFSEPPITVYQNRIDSLSHRDMNEQVQIIDFSFVGDTIRLDSNRKQPLYQPSGQVAIDDAALAIFETYINSATKSTKDDSINWLTVRVDDRDRLELSPLPADIYGGLAGVGLAFMSYYSAFKDYRAIELIQRIVNGCEFEINNPTSPLYISPLSYYSGAFGVLSFLQKAKKIPEINVSININHALEKLTQQIGSAGSNLDIIAGLSGTALSLHRKTASDFFSDQYLLSMGDELFNLVTKLWPKGDTGCALNASFAHGPSGVASALLNLFTLTGEVKFLHAWSEAWIKENDFRDISGKSWVDTRKGNKTPSPHWCHGLTGILLARNYWLKTDNEFHFLSSEDRRKIYAELNAAQRGVEDTGLRMDSLSLCHGVTGNLLALQSVSPERNLKDEWSSLAWHGLNKGWLCGLSTQFESMSAMTGLAGILQAFSLVKIENYTKADLIWPIWDFRGK